MQWSGQFNVRNFSPKKIESSRAASERGRKIQNVREKVWENERANDKDKDEEEIGKRL